MTKIRIGSLLSLLMVAAFAGFAQPGGGPGGGRPPGGGGQPCASPPCNPVPITGIELLLGMGSLLGIREALKRKKIK